MSLAQNMTDIRKEHGDTQKELSEKIGWSRPQIARYEIGTSTPTADYLTAFCTLYKVSADWLLELPKNCKEWRNNK